MSNGKEFGNKWYNAKKKRPERDKYVLGYDYYDQTYAVVSWDGVDWTDDNGICYNVTHWAELPEVDFNFTEGD